MDTKNYKVTTTDGEFTVDAESFDSAVEMAVAKNEGAILSVEQNDDVILITKKYVVTIEDDYGRKQYTINAIDFNEAYQYAVDNLMPRQVLISVKLSKIQ